MVKHRKSDFFISSSFISCTHFGKIVIIYTNFLPFSIPHILWASSSASQGFVTHVFLVNIVTKHDVISSRCQAISGWKCLFSQLVLTKKVKFVDKMKQTTYLCVIWHFKHKKWPVLSVFTWFLIQDGDQVWWRHRPPAAPPSIKCTSGSKIVSK